MPSWLPFALLALACPVGMGLMMWFMMRGMRGHQEQPMHGSGGTESPQQRLARLEAEKRALEREIAAAKEKDRREATGLKEGTGNR